MTEHPLPDKFTLYRVRMPDGTYWLMLSRPEKGSYIGQEYTKTSLVEPLVEALERAVKAYYEPDNGRYLKWEIEACREALAQYRGEKE